MYFTCAASAFSAHVRPDTALRHILRLRIRQDRGSEDSRGHNRRARCSPAASEPRIWCRSTRFSWSSARSSLSDWAIGPDVDACYFRLSSLEAKPRILLRRLSGRVQSSSGHAYSCVAASPSCLSLSNGYRCANIPPSLMMLQGVFLALSQGVFWRCCSPSRGCDSP